MTPAMLPVDEVKIDLVEVSDIGLGKSIRAVQSSPPCEEELSLLLPRY